MSVISIIHHLIPGVLVSESPSMITEVRQSGRHVDLSQQKLFHPGKKMGPCCNAAQLHPIAALHALIVEKYSLNIIKHH